MRRVWLYRLTHALRVAGLESEMTTVTITKRGFVKAVIHYDTSDADKALEIARMNYPQRGLKFRVETR